MVPGPTALPPEVVAAGARPILYSRSAEFVAIWEDVIERLRGVFQTEGEVLVFGASGSGAMDSAVANLAAPGERVLVASCGNFGVRWASICADHGVEAVHLEGEWGRPIDPAAVAEALAGEDGIDVVFVTQSETSTGVVSDLPALREAAGRG
jgi:aspartate aminotransferase-like enzyme